MSHYEDLSSIYLDKLSGTMWLIVVWLSVVSNHGDSLDSCPEKLSSFPCILIMWLRKVSHHWDSSGNYSGKIYDFPVYSPCIAKSHQGDSLDSYPDKLFSFLCILMMWPGVVSCHGESSGCYSDMLPGFPCIPLWSEVVSHLSTFQAVILK